MGVMLPLSSPDRGLPGPAWATSSVDGPKATRARISSARDTDAPVASILTTRDWLERAALPLVPG